MGLTKKSDTPSLHGLDVRTLRLFDAVASTGNLTQAAQANHLAVGAASRRISNFETMIGKPLFERSTRGLRLTPAGHLIAGYVKNILDPLNALGLTSLILRKGVEGRVHLLCVTVVILQHLPSLLSSFRTTHPNVLVEVEEGRSRNITQALLQRRANIGIIVDSAFVLKTGLLHFPYHTERMMLVAPTNHPLARFDRVRFEDTLDYEYIGHTPSGTIFSLLGKQAHNAGKAMRMHAHVSGVEGACRMAAAGLGLTVASEDLARSLKKPLKLKLIELEGDQYVFNLTVVHNDESTMTDLELSFLEHLRKSRDPAPQPRRGNNKHG